MPACKISTMGSVDGKAVTQSEERDIFPESYNEGVVSHAITEVRRATNLYISRLSNETEKEEDLTIKLFLPGMKLIKMKLCW